MCDGVEEMERKMDEECEVMRREFFSGLDRVKRQTKEITELLRNFAETMKNQGLTGDYSLLAAYLQEAVELINGEIFKFKNKSNAEYLELVKSEILLAEKIGSYSEGINELELEISINSSEASSNCKSLTPRQRNIVDSDNKTSEIKKISEISHKNVYSNVLELHDAENVKKSMKKFLERVEVNAKKTGMLNKWRDEKKKTRNNEEPQIFQLKLSESPSSISESRKKLENWRVYKGKIKESDEELKKEYEIKEKQEENSRKSEIQGKKLKVLEYKELKEFDKGKNIEKNKIISEYLKKKYSIETSEFDKKRIKKLTEHNSTSLINKNQEKTTYIHPKSFNTHNSSKSLPSYNQTN